ncbi:hypothetical protein [Nocardia beijingensis]
MSHAEEPFAQLREKHTGLVVLCGDRAYKAKKPVVTELTERIAHGRIVDGHGDLLAEDIFVLPDGFRILDCLDFDDELRYVDGLDDAAFLAMDL